MEIEDEDVTTFENDMTATIDMAETTFRPMLHILNRASQKVQREKNKNELEYSVDEFMHQYPHVNAYNFYAKATFDFVQTISNARCFFMIFKQLPPFPQTAVSNVKVKENPKLFFSSFFSANYITHPCFLIL